MTIKSWPSAERPVEKLIAQGPCALSDAELIAVLLGTGVSGASAVDLARKILERFGGLTALFAADRSELVTVAGIGAKRYALFQCVRELAMRHRLEKLDRPNCMTNPDAVKRFLTSALKGRHREVFMCLYLDSQHRVILVEELFEGTIDGASVYPREVVIQALKNQAAAIIFAHNHPSGIAEPSQADQRITQRLIAALKVVDIVVLDHMVVGDTDVVSFAERGLL